MQGPDPRKVFVVHGRNSSARDAVFAFLRSLGLEPIEWEHAIELTGEGTPYIGTVLDVAFSRAQAVVVLLTPDEITYLRSEYADGDNDPETNPAPQARPNVLFEAGMAMGRDSDRTVLVEFGQVREFTDVTGRHRVRLDNSAKKRKSLAQRLRTAGCAVNMVGDDWLRDGDLSPPGAPGAGLPLGKRVPGTGAAKRALFDLNYHNRGSGSSGRLQLINRGPETVYDVDLEFPPEAGNFHLMTDELPLSKLPSGKSVNLLASRSWGQGKDHFDVRVTGRMADGTRIEEEVFVSLTA